MAFTGGPINVVGIVPSYTANLGQQTSASGIVQAQNQIWQGAGQAFIGGPGQPLTGGLAGSPINIALNSDTVSEFAGGNTTLLSSGNNLIAPSLVGFLSGPQSYAMNQQLGGTLLSAGAFGALMSAGSIAGDVVGAAASVFGETVGAVGDVLGAVAGAVNYIMFPGGGGEAASNYSGIPYNLKDVTFSLQPANRGPQSFGSASATTNPTSSTTLPSNLFTSMPPLAGSPVVNEAKQVSMGLTNTSVSNLTVSGATAGSVFSSLNYGIR